MSTHQLRLFCYYLGYLSTYIYWGEESSAGLRVKQVGEREHERRALPGGFRGYPGARGNQKPEARGQRIQHYPDIPVISGSDTKGKKTRRNGDTVRDLPPGNNNHHYQSVRSDAMLLRGETGALRLRSLQLWQRGSVAARQPSPNNALALAHGLGPWALFLPWSWVSLPCLVLCVLLN